MTFTGSTWRLAPTVVAACLAAAAQAALAADEDMEAAGQGRAATTFAVQSAMFEANGSMLNVRFTVPPSKATQWVQVDPKDAYVLDESSGQKLYVMNLVRIGPAAQVRIPKNGGTSYAIFDNSHDLLKPGARVTVVIGALKQEHVQITEPSTK